MSLLRYVVVIPAGGGKTTLAKKHTAFLDVDALYNLKERQSTYDRINGELLARSESLRQIDVSVEANLRQRIADHRGREICLMVHTLAVAEKTALKLLGVFLPADDLHEASIEDREGTGLWFARTNRKIIASTCDSGDGSVKAEQYSSWSQFSQIVDEKLATVEDQANEKINEGEILDEQVVERGPKSLQDDEFFLLEILCTVVGASFTPLSKQ